MERPSSIVIDDVTYAYRRRQALNGVSWTLGPGIVGLLGPNGAGKTTLMNCLVGLRRPTTGTIATPGFGGSGSRVGYVPQQGSPPGHLRVREAVEYAAWLQGVPSTRLNAAAQDVIGLLGLEELADRRMRSLSGGERRRATIAAALAHRPSLLVLDEPTAGLDPVHRLSVRRAIANLSHIEVVLVSTHLIEDVHHLCSTVGVLDGGRMKFTGTVDELLARVPAGAADGVGSAFENAYELLLAQDPAGRER